MLIDENCLEAMLIKMRPADFGAEWCRAAFEAMRNLTEAGIPVDFVTVAGECQAIDGIAQKLLDAAELTPTTANADLYADIVKKNAMARRLAKVGNRLVTRDPDVRSNAVECVTELQTILDEASSAEVMGPKDWGKKFLEEELDIIADPSSAFCSTGWKIDKLLGGGLFRSGLYILGARPGMGKTTVALNIAEQVAARRFPVLFVSLEMNHRQVMCKRIAAWTSLPYRKLISGDINKNEENDMLEALEILQKRPLYVNNRFGLTVNDIAAMARQVFGCRMIIIDYFGLITVEGEVKGRYEDYTAISGRLKQLACQLNIPILCLAQLNRNTEGRADKRPLLSDLRDTGAIEQDADGVIFLHREGYYDKESEDGGSEVELILAKNRHGNTGTVRMYWEGEESRVSDYSNREG